MKEPIDPDLVRAGDLVRWESSTDDNAREWRVTELDSVRMTPRGLWFLLDRPKPPVDLPTEPTLGWVSSKYGGRVLGTWERHESSLGSRVGEVSALVRERDLPLRMVSKFAEATAVPTEALDRLREHLADYDRTGDFRVGDVRTFLAAVDAANGGHA